MSVKIDTSAFTKWKAQIQRTKIDVGYIDSPNHWMASAEGKVLSVGALASDLHYYSKWEDSFMLSESKALEVNAAVQWGLGQTLGKVPLLMTTKVIGEELEAMVRDNIRDVDSPTNDTAYAAKKGFNDPLVYGSHYGDEPNLISEVTHKVRLG